MPRGSRSSAAGVKPYRSFVVSCEDPDAEDDYRFDVTDLGCDGVTFRVQLASGALPEILDMTFAARVFDDAAGILSISQTNDVTHENERANRSWDGRHTRTVRFFDTTPPFVLSRRLARAGAATGRIDGLRFIDYLGPLGSFVRESDVERKVVVRGASRVLRAERYGAKYGAELLLVRRLKPYGEVNLVLRAARDGAFAVNLRSVD